LRADPDVAPHEFVPIANPPIDQSGDTRYRGLRRESVIYLESRASLSPSGIDTAREIALGEISGSCEVG